MWIFLNNAFFSIVEPENGSTDHLLVRARFAEDIGRIFPESEISYTPKRDYAYRAIIERNKVENKIAECIRNIDYTNFKNSTYEDWRHDVYSDVWSIMYDEQYHRKEK